MSYGTTKQIDAWRSSKPPQQADIDLEIMKEIIIKERQGFNRESTTEVGGL